MSPDSLNETDVNSKTYVVEEPDDNEKISQVSPFLASPTTDTSAPVNNQSDNVTGVSTLSNTSGQANATKPSETQCLSKTTSIDSWCSNDTLYNVEDNFDDIPIDPDLPPTEDNDNSNSSQTLTHNDEEDEMSRCPTYIIHNSQSEDGDSLTLNSMTYTKLKNENDDKSSASVLTKLETNDNLTTSTKNSPTKDLAYETLASSNSPLASYSNCTTAAFSGPNDPWKIYQPPEMVCKSLVKDVVMATPPRIVKDDGSDNLVALNTNCDITLNKMESIHENDSDDNLFENHEEDISLKKTHDSSSSESSYKQNNCEMVQDAISKENEDVPESEYVLNALEQHKSTTVANSSENTSMQRENISESNMCSIDASTLSSGYAEFQDSVRLKPQTFDSPSLFSQTSENGCDDVDLDSNELLLKHVYGHNQFLQPNIESNNEILTFINTSINNFPWQTLQPAYKYNHSIDPVRRSPIMDDFNISFTKIDVDKNVTQPELKNNYKPEMNKMESVEISCFNDHNDIQASEDLNKTVSIENDLFAVSDIQKCETKSLDDTNNHTVPNISETFQSPNNIISNSLQNKSLQPHNNESNIGSIDASSLSSGYAEFQDSARLKPQTIDSSLSSQKLDCDSDIVKQENADYLQNPKHGQNQLLSLDSNSEIEHLSDVLVNDYIDMSPSQTKSLENDFKCLQNICVPPTTNKFDNNNKFNKDPCLPVTSTPLTEIQDDASAAKVISLDFPSGDQNNSKIPNFEMFFQSAEIRPQEISPLSNTIGCDIQQNCVPAISSHRQSANYSSVTDNSINSTDEFHKFENSVRACPQDISGMDESETLDFDASGQVHSSTLFHETKLNPDLTSITVTGSEQDDTSVNSLTKNSVCNQDVSGAVVNTDLGWDESRIFPCYVTNDTLSTNRDGFVPDFIKTNNLERTDKLKGHLLNEELHTSKVVALDKIDTSRELTPDVDKSDLDNLTFNSHENGDTYNSHGNRADNHEKDKNESSNDKFNINNDENSINKINDDINQAIEECSSLSKDDKEISNISYINENIEKPQKYATVNYLSTPFEELVESNVDDSSIVQPNASPQKTDFESDIEPNSNTNKVESQQVEENAVCVENDTVEKSIVTTVTKDFLTQEKKFCQLSAYIPLLNDIRFTGK